MAIDWRRLAQAMFDIPPDADEEQLTRWEEQARKEAKRAEKKANSKKSKKS